MEAILSDLRIIEASAFVAAPLGGMTLQQLGAEVIRIDDLRGALDAARWPVTTDGTSLFWCGLNKGKRSVALDLSSEEGQELASALATAPGPGNGIVLTNLPPRGWLDFAKLSAARSDVIQLIVQGDRHGGSAVDYTINSRTGLPFLTGHGDRPVNHVLPAWDLITGQMAALGILAAERRRTNGGEGQKVTLALEDVALAVMGHLGLLAEAASGVTREPGGNDLYGAFGRDFVTSDGHRIMVVGLTPRQWSGLVEAVGIAAEIAQLERAKGLDLSREGNRYEARADIAALIEPWFAARTLAEATTILSSHRVCFGKYQSIKQLVTKDEACSTYNPMFSMLDQPGVGPVLAPASPLRFGASPNLPARPAPLPGIDTANVLSEILGISDTAYDRLANRKIVPNR